jgi:hypothetical protein
MTVAEIIERRDIQEIVHFTTNKGVLGTLAARSLLSRKRLASEKLLDHILKLNAAYRKDTAWLDFVSLSITRINSPFFSVSAGRWHIGQDIWWCILSFLPVILTHDNVYFATTNNIYPSVKRGVGCAGLEALFDNAVSSRYGHIKTRHPGMAQNLTTCE